MPAATPSGRSPLKMAGAVLELAKGTFAARAIIKRVQPAVLVGFGGYPTVPPVLGASLAGVKTIIHEQNAVMGRANRFLAGRATAIATGFAEVGGITEASRRNVGMSATRCGPPVRRRPPWTWPAEGKKFRLLVFGGSQGARVMADIVPPAIQLLTDARARAVVITQQARSEDHAVSAASMEARRRLRGRALLQGSAGQMARPISSSPRRAPRPSRS